MRRTNIVVAAAALVSLLLVAVAFASPGGTGRPFQATLAGVVTYVMPAGCPGTPPSIGNCAAFRANTAGTGQVTHLGRVQAYLSHLPYDFTNTHDGSMTLVAANGDKVYGAYDFDMSAEGPITVHLTGGTGRFAGASGTIFLSAEAIPQFKPSCDPATDFFGCMDPDVPWPWWATATGTIDY